MAYVWILMLVTALASATAGPVPTSKPVTTKRSCDFGRFKSLSPREVTAFRRAKNALEDRLLLRDCNCSSCPFPRTWDLRQLQVWERPVALEAEVALTLKVLGNVTGSSLEAVLDQPLGTLHYIHLELQTCLSVQPAAGTRPRGHLHHWLHRLREAQKKVSPKCLLASVTFNLFHLLRKDLNCVAIGDKCI